MISSMTQTALYNGVETIAAFSDPASELRTLTSGCGVFDLGWRAKIMVTGEDRVRWLNGMVTNNVKDLPLRHGNYNFLLSPQGRILGDMYIYNCGEYLLLDTDRSQLETVMKTLDHFIIMDDVELKESSLSAIGLCGPELGKVLATAGLDASDLGTGEFHDVQNGVIVGRGPEQKPGWYEIWEDRPQENRQQAIGNRQQENQNRGQGTGDREQENQDGQDRPQATGNRQQENQDRPQATGHRQQENQDRPQATGNRQQENQDGPQATGNGQQQNQHEAMVHTNQAAIWDRLVKAGAKPVGSDALELWRIMHGIPRYGQDIRERDLAQETEQNQALNFTKGCYIGQEIVERIRSRGQVHRKFTGFEFQDALPLLGKFEDEGRVMGEITSVAEIGGKKIGLGYVRREIGLPGAKLNVGGVIATVTTPPFKISSI